MSEFKIDDIVGITEYIKSLDIYDQFDKITVNHITEPTPMGRRATSIEIRIESDDRLVFIHTERRSFTSPTIDLNHYFDRDVKNLSASILFGRKLIECIETFDRFSVVDSDRLNLVIAEDQNARYVLRVYLNDEDIAVAAVVAKFKFSHGTFNSSHEFKIKSAVKIEQLKEVLESFEKLKNSIVFN